MGLDSGYHIYDSSFHLSYSSYPPCNSITEVVTTIANVVITIRTLNKYHTFSKKISFERIFDLQNC